MTEFEKFLETANVGITTPPGYLADLMYVWETPRQAGESEGQTNARELLVKSPKAFSDQKTKHLSEWLAVEKAAQERLTAEAMARSAVPTTSPSEELPDEGSERLFEIADQVFKGVGI